MIVLQSSHCNVISVTKHCKYSSWISGLQEKKKLLNLLLLRPSKTIFKVQKVDSKAFTQWLIL